METNDPRCELPSAEYLKEADSETQKEVMRDWFLANYEDPIESCPYESAEGGYQFIWGEPREADDVLEGAFSGLVPPEVIQELVDELEENCPHWSPVPSSEDYDETLFDDLAKNIQAIESYHKSIQVIKNLQFLVLENPENLAIALERLLFVNVITVLETYLSDTFIFRVSKDPKLMQRFIETCPDFQKEKIPISRIYEAVKEIEGKAKSYLLDVVWHNLPRVKPIYKDTLGLCFDNKLVKVLIGEIQKRHDIVHRNGKTKDGQEVKVDLDWLFKVVEEFVGNIELFLLRQEFDEPEV